MSEKIKTAVMEIIKAHMEGEDKNTKAVLSDVMQSVNELETFEQEPKWIPVSERLPEDKTYVLTTIKVPNRIAHARSGWYEGGFFHNDNGDTWKATDREVKAWMPLPKPYEPQESEIHCNCTDAEITKSFIEDVEAVKDLLPRAESEE